MTEGSDPGAAVWVLGDATRISGVRLHLPASWSVGPVADITVVRDEDVVLLVCPTVDEVAAMDRRLAMRPQLVVLLDGTSSADTIAAVLYAGADMCICTTSSAIVASHLMACRRRLGQNVARRRIAAG